VKTALSGGRNGAVSGKKLRGFGGLAEGSSTGSGTLPIQRWIPRKETYGLTSQIRRAAVSVPANIAEGFKKRCGQDKIRFMNIAQGSLEECRYYLILSRDLGYGETGAMRDRLEEVSRLLDAYLKGIAESH
jgi:four helix bundle protein